MSGVDKFLEGTGKVLETVPDLYDDALKPAAQESGKMLGRIPRTINAIFADWDKWLLGREYNVKMTEKLLEQKLANVNLENIVDPEMYVAVPALQALSYAIDSKELRELYANLLAKAMNSDTKDDVHPALVETIKQMSPHDAAYFKLLASQEIGLIVNIEGISRDDSYDIIQKNRNLFSDEHDYDNMNLSISNLTRLGLIYIPENLYWVSEAAEAQYNLLIEQLKIEYNVTTYPEYTDIRLSKGCILFTDFGDLFNKICIQE